MGAADTDAALAAVSETAADEAQSSSPSILTAAHARAHAGEADAPAHVHARPRVRAIAHDAIPGTTTYRLEVELSPSALNVYRSFGDKASPLKMRATALWRHQQRAADGAATHEARDGGDGSVGGGAARSGSGFVGGVAAQSAGITDAETAVWDSFLTVGLMVQDSRGLLSSRGLSDQDLGRAAGAANREGGE
eukprot:COSAG05_NODE_3431_length_2070_cov_1.361745_2_plen_193_part_00